MDIQFHGANCLTVDTKNAKVVIDDNLSSLGLKSVSDKATISLISQKNLKAEAGKDAFLIDGPGEYEMSQVSVHAIPARAHMEENGGHSATIFRVAAGGIMLLSIGHIYPELTDEQLEEIGMIDVLVIPVGGNGYTLDAAGAAKMVKKIEPKIVIPTHFKDGGIKYEVPQNELHQFVNELGSAPHEEEWLKLKGSLLPEVMTVYQLKRT